jgi:Mg-chelatase subunit ChlD
MTQSIRIATFGLVASLAVVGFAYKALAVADNQPSRRIEVAFVLDTTGSMANLIDGAKQKIWSIANTIIDINPNADIRMALIGYRDQGDDYVVRSFDMTADVQGLYGNLMRFKADGGGDTPESVNEALDAGVNEVGWSKDADVRRILFLVGDAPPHMDYANGPKYMRVIAEARDKAIIVNTVQAGADPETAEYWTDMARLGGGQYFAIPQDGGQVETVQSPFDEDIIRLQGKIDGTIILYGTKEKQAETRAKVDTRSSAPSSVQVDNSRYYSKKTASKEVVTGGGDLLDDVRNNVRTVDDLKAEELPDGLKDKSADELAAIVAERTAERQSLEAEMAELVRKRDEFVAGQAGGKTGAGRADSFDRSVNAALSAQF